MPGLRLLDKWAVAIGGGANHRMGLYDMLMIKDNHIAAAGGITAAVHRAQVRFVVLAMMKMLSSLLQVMEALSSMLRLQQCSKCGIATVLCIDVRRST